MNSRFYHKLFVFVLSISLIEHCFALDEVFDTYSSVACLAQGNACTASVSGYASHFYNPAGLGRFTKKTSEVHLVVAETHGNIEAFGHIVQKKTIGIYPLLSSFQSNPGDYQFFNLSSLPSITFRNFSFALLGSYQIAGVSDGSQLDINARQDLIPTLSISRHFAGNLLRLGISAKGIYRNELKGVYQHSTLASLDSQQLNALRTEGLGLGFDAGMLLTLPYRFLPTLGITWNHILGTQFNRVQYLNSQATNSPDKIPQSFHAGFSLSPQLSHSWRGTLSVDYRHIEVAQWDWKKHFHLGVELQKEKVFFLWAGMNQFYLTGGMGLRLTGGHLEVGTYAKEKSNSLEGESDRRYFMRYTISF